MMHRFALTAVAAFFPLSATAWEAGVDGALCTLTHTATDHAVLLTFDPSVPLYTISITGSGPWEPAPAFAIRFEGAQPNTITTTRQTLTPDRFTLSVSDRGFDNVLNGIEFNSAMIAVSGASSIVVNLMGAADEVAAFRSCGLTPTA